MEIRYKKLSLWCKSHLKNLYGDLDRVHLIVYVIPSAILICFLIYCLVSIAFYTLFDVQFHYDPNTLLDLFLNIHQLALGPTQYNPLVLIWNWLLLAFWSLIIFNATIIAPIFTLYVVFKVITAPFKKEFLDAFAEFLMGLFFGATIYLAVAAFADDTTIWRLGGAVLGFVATLSFLVYAIAYG